MKLIFQQPNDLKFRTKTIFVIKLKYLSKIFPATEQEDQDLRILASEFLISIQYFHKKKVLD